MYLPFTKSEINCKASRKVGGRESDRLVAFTCDTFHYSPVALNVLLTTGLNSVIGI